MTTLRDDPRLVVVLQDVLHRAFGMKAHPDLTANALAMFLSDPAFRDALTEAVLMALKADFAAGPHERQTIGDYAAAIVARMLPKPTKKNPVKPTRYR